MPPKFIHSSIFQTLPHLSPMPFIHLFKGRSYLHKRAMYCIKVNDSSTYFIFSLEALKWWLHSTSWLARSTCLFFLSLSPLRQCQMAVVVAGKASILSPLGPQTLFGEVCIFRCFLQNPHKTQRGLSEWVSTYVLQKKRLHILFCM